ncbi:MAG: HDOD domain-containing protein [Verrucomicrobia bacterium]|nr:HDOD domain-containing protein [Verrucomicrobiota bacterium]
MKKKADTGLVGLTLAQQTIKRVADGLEAGEAAGLSEIVELIQQLSGHALDTSVQELAGLIGKDLVVTTKVICAANTMGYNPTGVEVSTISQAIHVIGFNKIRQLAVSLLLIENAERTLNPTEKREIAALALCSGLMAESVMEKHGSNNPEQAFICASLRNYGRILMTTFMIEEYRRARTMAMQEGASEDEAFNQVFGLTPLELGYHLLESAHLPEPILKSMRALPPDAVRKASQNPDVELLLLADLSVKLCEFALRSDLSAEEFEKNARALSNKSGRAFGLDVDGLLGALNDTGQQLNSFAAAFGLKALTGSLGPRLHERVSRKDPAGFLPLTRLTPIDAEPVASNSTPGIPVATDSAAPVPADRIAPPAPTPVTASSTVTPPIASTPDSAPPATRRSEPPTSSEAIFQRAFDTGIDQLASLLDEQPVNMDKVFRVVLQAAMQGFTASEGVLFVRDRASLPYSAQQGKGPIFDAIRRQPLVRESDRNVCGICLQRLEDVFINDATDAKIVLHLPPWLKASKLASFVLLPIHENKRPFALMLAGWPDKKTMGFTVSQIRQVRSLLKLVGTAHRLAGI